MVAPLSHHITYSLHADNIGCERSDHTLFNGLSFTVSAGDVLKLEGANGAGKTSLLRILAGLLPSHGGKILWNNVAISQHFSSYCAQLHYIGHSSGIKRDLTVYENLFLAQTLAGGTGTPILQAAQKLHLDTLLDHTLDELSAGQKRRVALAKLLISYKTLWLLDEPFTAMDSDGIGLLQQLLTAHAKQGGISIVSTHQPLELPGVRMQSIKLGQST